MLFGRSNSDTIGNETIVSDGQSIGRLSFGGSDGTAQISAAWIDAQIDGTPGTNDMPGCIVFYTTPDGASTPTEKMRLTSGGILALGTSSPALTGTGLLDMNSDTFRLRTQRTPASSGDTCNAGEYFADADYFYYGTATNTIKRIAWTTF
jgi:hypothetical protein